MTTSAVTKLVVLSSVLVCAVLMYAAGRPADGQAAAAQNKQRPSGQQEIACPAPQVRAEITTSLAKPWFQTPQIGKLQSADIQVIGGQKTLVCHYHAYSTLVSVMRLFPENAHDCKADGNHFVCR